MPNRLLKFVKEDIDLFIAQLQAAKDNNEDCHLDSGVTAQDDEGPIIPPPPPPIVPE